MTDLWTQLSMMKRPDIAQKDLIIFVFWTILMFGLGLLLGWVLFKWLGI